MGGETVTESWFSSLWRTSLKSIISEPEKAVIGILAFEVVSLMSKVVNLWQCLSDKQIVRLREEIVNSLGTQKLVSDDDEYLMDLALAEIIDNLVYVAKSVARIGKRSVDPVYHHLENVFDDLNEIHLNWCGWEYKLKKMERKVKKMERFIAATAQLHQELEVLAELEQSLRRMQGNANSNQVKLLEFQQKVLWQRQEVKNLRDMSPWVRSYDYTVRILLRSLITIVERIKHVFGTNQFGSVEEHSSREGVDADCLLRSQSFSALMQSSVHPSENGLSRFYSGPLGRSISNLGMSTDKIRRNNKQWQARHHSKTRRSANVGPFKGCMTSGSDSPILNSCMPTSARYLSDVNKLVDTNIVPFSNISTIQPKMFYFSSKRSLLNAPPSTLGDAALALHYANVILLIEKLSSTPHLISLDARDDLYNMLPSGVRTSLRSKLKLFSKTLASTVYDASLAAEWSLATARILDWLAPLAHNMIRWHSERNFEKQHMVSGTNVLLVQTLYFANKAKTEAAITELLMGLNYLSRFGIELDVKAFMESAGSRACDNNLVQRNKIVCSV